MGGDLFSLKACDVMTCSPRTVEPAMLAARALSVMEKYSITVLVTTDNENRVAGVLHLHDLLKAGIV